MTLHGSSVPLRLSSSLLPLEQGCLHLWLCRSDMPVSQALHASYWTMLNTAERDQYNRFRFKHLRQNYLLTRALLRITLSKYVPAVAPKQWLFGAGQFGKPYIDQVEGRELEFNLSHAGSWIALAVRRGEPVGIDIEPVPAQHDVVEAVSNYFTRAEIDWLSMHERCQQRDAFIRLWVMKEAYIKATGKGLSAALDSFAVDFNAKEGVKIYNPASPETTLSDPWWQMALLQLDRDYRIGLALTSTSEASSSRLVWQQSIPMPQPIPAMCLMAANGIDEPIDAGA